ncbi:hypothetical protein [Methylobacterium aquaticum]|uniref:Uncharacterized protein n=1 Tax=Methylobacterium aquaticum TaxID=270351 RepID=A0A0C6FTF8_9HYPH|nr:hypothetical protein [Methylobacterium aquaticum]BAQ50377.1 hypothetical protein Maq22A_4p60105 [Methylobacterium aquaticum]
MHTKLPIHLPGPTPDQIAYVEKLINSSVVDLSDPRLDARVGPAARSEIEEDAEIIDMTPEQEKEFFTGMAVMAVERGNRVRELEAENARLREIASNLLNAMPQQLKAFQAVAAERLELRTENARLREQNEALQEALHRASQRVSP